MTTEVRTPPHHNTLTCYKSYGCRLPECIERNRAYGRTVTRRQAYGTWNPFVDAEPARQHLLDMRQAGLTLARAAEVTGLSTGTISSILYVVAGRPRRKRLRIEHANRILAITPQDADPDLTDATGTRRRIEALQVVGWPKHYMAQRLNVNVATAGRITRNAFVRASTAQAVAALYADLKVRLPENNGILPWIADRVRRQAHAQGWHGPLAWDGNIDDPAALPDTEGEGTDGVRRRDRQRNEEIKHLAGFQLSAHEIAKRVGLPLKDVEERLVKIRAEKAKAAAKQQVAA